LPMGRTKIRFIQQESGKTQVRYLLRTGWLDWTKFLALVWGDKS
jgi:hypothetical protein